MKLLLTSAGLTNETITGALVELLGKPLAEATAIFIPTAMYSMPDAGWYAWEAVQEQATIGWQRVGILELTALPSILEQHWLPALTEADVLIVGGGNTPYLCYWLHASGLADKLPDVLRHTVYVGVSAGSLVVAHSFNIDQATLATSGIYDDDQYGDVAPLHAGSNTTLKLVDFTLRPHLNADYLDRVSLRDMEQAAAKVDVPLYAIDDQTAVKVVDGAVDVVSEGVWKVFNAA